MYVMPQSWRWIGYCPWAGTLLRICMYLMVVKVLTKSHRTTALISKSNMTVWNEKSYCENKTEQILMLINQHNRMSRYDVLNLYSSLNVKDQVSHPFERPDEIVLYILLFTPLDTNGKTYSEVTCNKHSLNVTLSFSWFSSALQIAGFKRKVKGQLSL
jgi:hypothetical protein